MPTSLKAQLSSGGSNPYPFNPPTPVNLSHQRDLDFNPSFGGYRSFVNQGCVSPNEPDKYVVRTGTTTYDCYSNTTNNVIWSCDFSPNGFNNSAVYSYPFFLNVSGTEYMFVELRDTAYNRPWVGRVDMSDGSIVSGTSFLSVANADYILEFRYTNSTLKAYLVDDSVPTLVEREVDTSNCNPITSVSDPFGVGRGLYRGDYITKDGKYSLENAGVYAGYSTGSYGSPATYTLYGAPNLHIKEEGSAREGIKTQLPLSFRLPVKALTTGSFAYSGGIRYISENTLINIPLDNPVAHHKYWDASSFDDWIGKVFSYHFSGE